jgi:hypothetical protein
MEDKINKEVYVDKLVNSLLYFTQIFYLLRTICKALMDVFDGKTNRLIINVPPRYGKSELLIHFVAWALAQYPDSNFIYVSYSHSLAKKQTQTIRNIIQMTEYKDLFKVMLKDDTSAKDNFETIQRLSQVWWMYCY